jgi:hypothetical protein
MESGRVAVAVWRVAGGEEGVAMSLFSAGRADFLSGGLWLVRAGVGRTPARTVRGEAPQRSLSRCSMSGAA